MNNFKVLLVSKQLTKIGGVQAVVKQLEFLLSNHKIDIETFSFSEQSIKIYKNNFLTDFFKLLKFHIMGVDAFIYTITGYQIIIYSIISLIFRRKIIYWEHGNPVFLNKTKSYKILKKYFYAYSKAIVIIHPEFNTHPHLPYMYIPNPYLSMKNFLKEDIIPINKVIWVGRISEEKQPDLAFAAMVKSAEVNKKIEFYFVHSPFNCNTANIPLNFNLIDGSKYYPDTILDANTLLLLTSTAEAMPGVVFEALANGSTILSSSCTPWISDVSKITGNKSFDPMIDASVLSLKINDAIKNGNNINSKYLLELFDQINPAHVGRQWISVLF